MFKLEPQSNPALTTPRGNGEAVTNRTVPGKRTQEDEMGMVSPG